MLGPSPDWLGGVSKLSLCLPNCTWIENVMQDLYPFDAGTDSGVSYNVKFSLKKILSFEISLKFKIILYL